MAKREETKIEFDICMYPGFPRLCMVVLDARGDVPRVYMVHVYAGDGVPAEVWNRRCLVLGQVAPSAVPESVLAYLQAREDRIAEIASGFRGIEWDGSRHVGRWESWVRDEPDLVGLDDEGRDQIERYYRTGWRRSRLELRYGAYGLYWDAAE